jgi:hypothetical protein
VSGATTVLLNDLDITLTDESSKTNIYPLVVSSSNSNSQQQQQQGEHDHINPVEIIRLTSPTRNTTYTLTVSAHKLVTTQPYALIISGNIGQYPYSPPQRDYTMYLLAGLLMMTLITCCILGCVYWMTKRNAKNEEGGGGKGGGRGGARLEDDEDDEITEREEDREEDKNRRGRGSSSSHNPTNRKKNPSARGAKPMKKKIYPE